MMLTTIASCSLPKNIVRYGLAYLLWFVNIGVCVVVLIQMLSTLNVFWVALGGDRYALGVVNQVCLLAGAFIAFAYIVILENRYRESVRSQAPLATTLTTPTGCAHLLTNFQLGLLLRRFAITTAIPIFILLTSLAMLEIAIRILAR